MQKPKNKKSQEETDKTDAINGLIHEVVSLEEFLLKKDFLEAEVIVDICEV